MRGRRGLSMEMEMCMVNCTDDCEEGMAADEMFCGEFCRDACGVYDLEDAAEDDDEL